MENVGLNLQLNLDPSKFQQTLSSVTNRVLNSVIEVPVNADTSALTRKLKEVKKLYPTSSEFDRIKEDVESLVKKINQKKIELKVSTDTKEIDKLETSIDRLSKRALKKFGELRNVAKTTIPESRAAVRAGSLDPFVQVNRLGSIVENVATFHGRWGSKPNEAKANVSQDLSESLHSLTEQYPKTEKFAKQLKSVEELIIRINEKRIKLDIETDPKEIEKLEKSIDRLSTRTIRQFDELKKVSKSTFATFSTEQTRKNLARLEPFLQANRLAQSVRDAAPVGYEDRERKKIEKPVRIPVEPEPSPKAFEKIKRKLSSLIEEINKQRIELEVETDPGKIEKLEKSISRLSERALKQFQNLKTQAESFEGVRGESAMQRVARVSHVVDAVATSEGRKLYAPYDKRAQLPKDLQKPIEVELKIKPNPDAFEKTKRKISDLISEINKKRIELGVETDEVKISKLEKQIDTLSKRASNQLKSLKNQAETFGGVRGDASMQQVNRIAPVVQNVTTSEGRQRYTPTDKRSLFPEALLKPVETEIKIKADPKAFEQTKEKLENLIREINNKRISLEVETDTSKVKKLEESIDNLSQRASRQFKSLSQQANALVGVRGDIAQQRVNRLAPVIQNVTTSEGRQQFSALDRRAQVPGDVNRNTRRGGGGMPEADDLGKIAAKFSLIDRAVDGIVDGLIQLPGILLDVTTKLDSVKTRLAFAKGDIEDTEGAKVEMQELYEEAQRLGLAWVGLADNFATFTASVRGTTIEKDVEDIFSAFSEAGAALKISNDEMFGVFRALSQMASKGVVSMEEYRQQIGDRLPIATKSGVTALQMMVDNNEIAIQELVKGAENWTEAQKKAYRVSRADLDKYISTGNLRSAGFMKNWATALSQDINLPESGVDGMLSDINRLINALTKMAGAFGETLAPIFAKVAGFVTDIADSAAENMNKITDSFTGIGKVLTPIVDVLGTVLAETVKFLLPFLDELAIALLVVFGGALWAAAAAAISAVAAVLAPIAPTVAIIVGAILVLKASTEAIIKVLDNLTGGALTKLQDKLKEGIDAIKEYWNEWKKGREAAKKAKEAIQEQLSTIGEGIGGKAGGFFDEAIENIDELQNKYKGVDLSENYAVFEVDTKAAKGELNEYQAEREKFVIAIEANNERLILAQKIYEKSLSDPKHMGEVKQVEAQILDIKKDTLEKQKQLNELDFNQRLKDVQDKSKEINDEVAKAEYARILLIQELNKKGIGAVGELEEERIAQSKEHNEQLIQNGLQTLNELTNLRSKATTDDQRAQIDDLIVETQKNQIELMQEKINLEQELQDELKRQLDIEMEAFQLKADNLEILSETRSIQAEIAKAQADLTASGYELSKAQYDLSIAHTELEKSRLEMAMNATSVLLQMEGSRKQQVAELLGLESDTTPIDILHARQQQEQELYDLKRRQIQLQAEADRSQLEADKVQLKFDYESRKFKLESLKIENDIAVAKAKQALESSKEVRKAALEAGDTKKAGELELDIVTKKRELEILNKNTLDLQSRALERGYQSQKMILEDKAEMLELTEEQQLAEADITRELELKNSILEAEQRILEASSRYRSADRDMQVELLRATSEIGAKQAETLALELQLSELRAEQATAQDAYNALLADATFSSEDQAILIEAQANLHEKNLEILQVENSLAQQRKAIQTELNEALEESKSILLDSTTLALEYGTEEQQNQAKILELKNKVTLAQEEYNKQLEKVTTLESGANDSAESQLLTTEAKTELQKASLDLLESEYQLESELANSIADQRENALKRQNDLLTQRASLISAESDLEQAKADLKTTKFERRLIDVDYQEKTGLLNPEQAEMERLRIEQEMLASEESALEKQQNADDKRLRIEQQIEEMRMRASKAESDVAIARAKVAESEARNALAKAVESGDADAINSANFAVTAAEEGVKAATQQSEIIQKQIDGLLELQKLQRETQDIEQKAASERLNNKQRELEYAQQIAFAKQEQNQNNTGYRVSGGGVSAGNSYIVGENGVEVFQGGDGSSQILGLNGASNFIPRTTGTIIPNNKLTQEVLASVMGQNIVDAILNSGEGNQNILKKNYTALQQLSAVLTNRTAKPIVVNQNIQSSTPFNPLNARLARL